MRAEEFSCSVAGAWSEYPEAVSVSAPGDVLLPDEMPRVEYMYGCTPTAMAMLLGYYDLYGYDGADYSNLVAGTVSVNSRGSDGNIYNMNEFDSVLGSFVATEDFVWRFHERNGVDTTPSQELEYTFVNGGVDSSAGLSVVDTSRWNCLADYLGTGQYWRGADNYASWIYYTTLSNIVNPDFYDPITVEADGISRTFDWRYNSSLYGLLLYVESRGYSLDYSITRTERVDTYYNGKFTFEDYMAEIDAGRVVMISITGHSMVGYGYNAATREIIFDNTYSHDERMTWGGSYYYSGEYRSLQAITVIGLTGGGTTPGDIDITVSTALTEGVVCTGSLILKNSGSVNAAGVAVQLTTNGKTAALEGGSIISDSAALLFGSSANDPEEGALDGTVRFTGKTVSITVSSPDDAYGILGKNLTLQFTGSGNGAAGITIEVSGETHTYGIRATGALTSSGVFGGILIAGGNAAVGISARNALAISISGTVYAGVYAPALSILQNFEVNKELLLAESRGSTALSGGANSTITLSGEARILGGITLGNGSSIIISDSAAVYGGLSFSGNVSISITLKGRQADEAVFTVSSHSGLGGASISVDATGASAGMYVLVDGAGGADGISSILLSGRQLSAGNSVEIGNYRYTLSASGSQLRLSVGRSGDSSPPVLSGVPRANSGADGVTFRWENAIDNIGVAGYILKINDETYVVSGTSRTVSLAPGSYAYSLQAYDAAGNFSSWSAEQQITVTDITPPVLAGAPTAEANGLSVTFRWSEAYDLAGVAGYYLRVNGRNYDVRDTSLTVTLAAGEFSYSLQAYDEAGNRSEWSTVQHITLGPLTDTAAPVLKGLPSAQVEDGKATISWNPAEDNVAVAGYTVSINGELHQVTGTFLSLNLGIGEYFYSIRAYDAAGNTSEWSAEKSFRVTDDKPPVFTSLPRVSIAGKDSFVIQWKEARDNFGVAGYTVEINGVEYKVGSDRTYLRLEELSTGSYTYRVQAFDAAGNTSDWTDARSVTLEEKHQANFFELYTGTLSGQGTLYFDRIALTAGLYKLSGDFGSLSCKVTIIDLDNRNKKISTSTVKNGVLTFKKALLLDGNYAISVTGSKGSGSGNIALELLSDSIYYRADNSDDNYAALGETHRLTVGASAQMLAEREWVGYGDTIDYRQVTLGNAGRYTFDLSAFNDAAKLTVFRINPKNGKLQKLKTVSVKAGNTGQIKHVLLDAGVYYFAVESTTAKKGGGTEYSSGINAVSTIFTQGNNADDDYRALGMENRFSLDDGNRWSLAAGDWVGYGDAIDYRELTTQYDGIFDLSISGLSDSARLTVYTLQKGKLKKLKSVSAKQGEKTIAGLSLNAGETYWVAVESTTAKKGGSTNYSLELETQYSGVGEAARLYAGSALPSVAGFFEEEKICGNLA